MRSCFQSLLKLILTFVYLDEIHKFSSPLKKAQRIVDNDSVAIEENKKRNSSIEAA